MATTPIFAATPKLAVASLTTACGATDFGTAAPTNVSTLLAAGSSGSKLRRIKAKNRGTAAPAANILRVYLLIGGLYHPHLEIDIPAGATPSASVKSQESVGPDSDGWVKLDLDIPSGTSIAIAQTVANSIAVTCEYADY